MDTKQPYKHRYSLLKIDVTDTVPFADFFDDDHYVGFHNSEKIEEILDLAVIGFWKLNPNMKTYQDWETKAEDGGFDFQIVADKKMIFRSSLMLSDPRIMGAIFLIREYHSNQTRKGDGFAHLEHPLEVGYRLWRDHFSSDVVIAGFCHDLLEDTKCTKEEIREKCGEVVLHLVKAVSNDETLSDKKDWEKKKEKYIKTVIQGGEKAISISVMDKICNLESFFDQYEKEGSSLWKKFNRGKDKKLWFEKEVYKMAKKYWNHPLLKEFKTLIDKLEKTNK
jgi:(p)ppGpp synthase/HD superfamily hydrolase